MVDSLTQISRSDYTVSPMRAPHSPGDKHRMSLMDMVLLSSQPASRREKNLEGLSY